MLTQAFADLALDLVAMREQRIERRVLVEPLGSRLRADLWHARYVVRGIADQREVVDDLLGIDVELGLDPVTIEPRVGHGVDERYAAVDQLRHVLVAGRDHDFDPDRSRALCQRADHVVGLDAGDTQQRQPERLDRGDQRVDLRAQVVGHRRAVGLVLCVQVVAKRAPRGVEHDADQRRLILLEQLEQHVEDAEHGAGRLATGIGQRRQGVERPVQVGRAVHQHQAARLNHGCCRGCPAAAPAAAAARFRARVPLAVLPRRRARAGSRRFGVSPGA